jgi:hypothetical protein
MAARRQSGKPPAKTDGVSKNSTKTRWPEHLLPAVGIGLVCGIAETAGRHVSDISTTLAQNPWSASGVGGVMIGAVAASGRGRATIASILRWATSLLHGRAM